MAIFERDGLELYYEVKADASSEKTIAFFNGVMASCSSWNAFVPLFERFGYRVILHDFKGQLLSSKPRGPYTFAQHAEEAKELFLHAGARTVHIVGTSYGGEVAMAFAAAYPEMTKSITVIDSVSELDGVLEAFLKNWVFLCESGSGKDFFNGIMPAIYGRNFIRDNREMLAARADAADHFPKEYLEGQKILYDTFLKDMTMTDALYKISCPALVVCGEEDILKPPRFSKIIADRIKGAEYITLPECGHVAIFEKQKELESAILGFILKNDR
jgi:3-oxoadipate enol-lactonase